MRHYLTCALIASLISCIASTSFAQISPFLTTLSETLTVDDASSLLNVSVDVDTPLGDDSDNDNTSISGNMDIDFGLDFSTGNLRVSEFSITNGALVADDNMQFSFSILFGAFQANAVTNGIAGTPSTDSVSLVLPNATPTTTGLFAASDHGLLLDSGTISVSGDLSQTIDLSVDPVGGQSQSATPGEVIVTQGVTDEIANTTTYSLSVVLPVSVSASETTSTAVGNVTTTISANGSVKSDLTDLVFDFVPWNGLQGDVNQDGVVSTGSGIAASDDVVAFVEGWLSTDLPLGLNGIKQGDLNFDRQTDLNDAFLLREALVAQGLPANFGSLLGGVATPEPGALALLVSLGVGLLPRRR